MWFETVSQNKGDDVKVNFLTQCPTNSFKAIPSPATRFDVNGLVRGVRRAVRASVAIASDPFQWKVFWVDWQTHFWCAVLHIHLCCLGKNAERRKRVDGVVRLIKCPQYMREVCVWVTRGGEAGYRMGVTWNEKKVKYGEGEREIQGREEQSGKVEQKRFRFSYILPLGVSVPIENTCSGATVPLQNVECIYFYLLTFI